MYLLPQVIHFLCTMYDSYGSKQERKTVTCLNEPDKEEHIGEALTNISLGDGENCTANTDANSAEDHSIAMDTTKKENILEGKRNM